jgi:hypothetical protein
VDLVQPVKEVREVPSGHVAGPLLANVLEVVGPEQLETMAQNSFLMEQRTLKNVNNCLNTNVYSYLETSGA